MSSLSREQFVNDVLDLVGRRFPLVKIARASGGFSMLVNGHVASLENVYRLSVLRPQDTRRHVERWIVELLRASEGLPDTDGSFDQLRERIMPLIVPEHRQHAGLITTQPFVDGLCIAYGMDNDRTISYVTSQRLAAWKVSVDDLHQTALENLSNRSQTMNAHAAQDDDGNIYLIIFQTMDGYDASRLMLPNLHEKLAEHLGSPFAAAIPNRDILLCFNNKPATIDQLLPQIQNDYAQMPHQVTDQILLVTRDGIARRI